ncbi:hypothetical protein Tco_0190487 [Tanacetum coccineum]
MTSFDYRLNPIYAIKECSSCGSLYTSNCGCSKGSLEDKILVPKPPRNCVRCARCGTPVDGPYCQGCALLRKEFMEGLFTNCVENEFFKDFQDTSESSDDNTNVVNAPREPIVVNQDPGENSSPSPPHIDHCCHECGDSNEITRFQHKFDETFCEAWDRFNDLLRGCPHHGFSELHQLNTFYNALNSIDQDSLNSAAGGNFLDKMPRECLKIIESKSKVRQSRNKAVVAKMSTSSSTPAISSDVAELKDMVRALILDRKNQTPASAPVKAVEQSCVTCGGGHSYQNCPATNSNIYHDNIQEYVSQAAAANFNQANSGYRPPMVSNQIRPPGFPPIQNPHANSQNNFNRGNNFNQNRGNNFNQGQIYRPPVNQPVAHQGPAPQTHGVSKTDFERYVTANDAVLRNMQNQGQNLQSQMANLTDMLLVELVGGSGNGGDGI